MKTLALPVLAYALNSLSPNVSETTMEFHYGKHLAAYVNNVNEMVVGTEFANMELDYVVMNSSGSLFNNAAQAWNHIFYFEQFAEKSEPIRGTLADAIIQQWGSVALFKEEFSAAAATLFGSGWVWLSVDKYGMLHITKEQDAGNPILKGATPLMTIDVWEHAYYLDYQNNRKQYISNFWNILDWRVVEARYGKHIASLY